MSSDMKVRMKRTSVIDFLHVDNYSLVFMLSVYGDQTVDMSKCMKNDVVSDVADFYERRIQVLVPYWQKCISTGGDSGENNVFFNRKHPPSNMPLECDYRIFYSFR